MVPHAFGTLAAIVIAAVFFTVPLFIKFHVYKPHVKHVASGDTLKMKEGFSSTWCQAVELSSDVTFQTFLYESHPHVNDEDVRRTVSFSRMTLPNYGQKHWEFYLLQGSKVNISSCVRLFGADLTVVKGHKALKRCQAERRHFLEKGVDSGEESQSESESDDVTSSISSSQGAVSNETDRMYRCKDALHFVHVPHSYPCRASIGHASQQDTLYHSIESTDHYYYVFSSETYLDIIPNEFAIQFTIDRTHYDYDESSSNCSSQDKCHLDLCLGSEQEIVAQLDGVDGPLKIERIMVTCKPREWIFLIFYAGFLLTIFFCAFQ